MQTEPEVETVASVEVFYDHGWRGWTVLEMDPEGNQIGEAMFEGVRSRAEHAANESAVAAGLAAYQLVNTKGDETYIPVRA